ncbi:type II secretion system protein GspL [Parendozoicomonas sp. Alg238-R29]|uniref:type II secretion system protein GspL n=1 Tax=Parendozoicomonas sp. Alg238-R29 TaxID=2993446 RepID=UPI00248E635C|nr:type II secretion system protein GspL [Parendozoicomonas sp. Alg238-R29]
MKTQLIVRLRPGSDLNENQFELEWVWGMRDGTCEGSLHNGSLEQLAAWRQGLPLDEQDLPVILIVSGSFSSSHVVFLNENQRKHWQQALPYLLEEQLASDLESQHLVFSQIGDDHVHASCIGRDQMSTIVKAFVAADVDPLKVIAETQLLKGKNGLLSVWLEGEHAFVASQNGFAQWLDQDALPIMIPGLLEEEAVDGLVQSDDEDSDHTHIVTGITIYTISPDLPVVGSLVQLAGSDVPVDIQQREHESLLILMMPEFSHLNQKRKLLDFRTGSFKCNRRASRRWRQWRPVAIVAGVWLSVELLFNIGSGFYFQQQAEELRDENFSTYKELRPDDRRVVDVRHNLTKFLRDSSRQKSSADFLNLLQVLSSVSGDDVGKSITPKNMDFNDANGRLSLDVQAESFDLLNRYVDALKAAGLNARMETGNQDAKGVSARLIVRRA